MSGGRYNAKCNECGKLFFIGERGAYAYKHVIYSYKKGKFTGYNCMGYFCSWKCLRRMEAKHYCYEVK